MIQMKKMLFIIYIWCFLVGTFYGHSQNFQIDENAIGILKQGEINIGTAFICEYPNIIVSCRHTIENLLNLSFNTRSGSYEVEVLDIGISKDYSILRLKHELDVTPIIIDSFNHKISINDSIRYYGYDMRMLYNLDTIFPVNFGDSRIRSFGKTNELDVFELDFIDFYGQGIPGYSGGPILNKQGLLIAIIYKGYQENSLKSGSGIIVNKGVIPYDLKKSIDEVRYSESIWDKIMKQANKNQD